MTARRSCSGATATRRSTTSTRTGPHIPPRSARCCSRGPRARRSRAIWTGSVRRDGSMFPVSYVSAPIEMPGGRGAVVAFSDIEDRLRTERLLREHDALLAAREASLRRIATLVAGGAASAGGVRRHRPGGGAGAGRFAGGDLALRTRPPRDRRRRLGRSTASFPGRHHLAGGGAHGRRDAPGDGPPYMDRGLRGDRRHDSRRHSRDRDPLRQRRGDHRRRRTLGRDGCRCRGERAAGRPHRGSARGVHRAGRHNDLEQREPRRSLPGWPTSRRRCGAWRRWSRRACRRASSSAPSRRRSVGCSAPTLPGCSGTRAMTR